MLLSAHAQLVFLNADEKVERIHVGGKAQRARAHADDGLDGLGDGDFPAAGIGDYLRFVVCFVVVVCAAAGAQAEEHCKGEQCGYDLFHAKFPFKMDLLRF